MKRDKTKSFSLKLKCSCCKQFPQRIVLQINFVMSFHLHSTNVESISLLIQMERSVEQLSTCELSYMICKIKKKTRKHINKLHPLKKLTEVLGAVCCLENYATALKC